MSVDQGRSEVTWTTVETTRWAHNGLEAPFVRRVTCITVRQAGIVRSLQRRTCRHNTERYHDQNVEGIDSVDGQGTGCSLRRSAADHHADDNHYCLYGADGNYRVEAENVVDQDLKTGGERALMAS